MAWVQEKLPSATAQDYGQSLSTVRHLQEKHQVLTHAEGWEGLPQRYWKLTVKDRDTVIQHSLCFGEHLVSMEVLGWKFLVNI